MALLLLLVLFVTQIAGHNIQRGDDGRPQELKPEIDFFSVETDKFFDELDKAHEGGSRQLETTKSPGAQKKMFVLFVSNDHYTGVNNDSTPLDSWSVVWYIASFGGLIVFFLIVSCSEWCCRRAIRNSQQNFISPANPSAIIPDTPPPSYEQFAPPSYESICLGRNSSGEKSEYDIYVVPVHTFGSLVESRRREDAPPSYLSASGRF